jgi:transcriptional regulator with XRE-family HTH domain
MVRNQENLDQATRLRERGFTLAEIAKVCDVSKSTISKWLAGNAASADVTIQNKRRAGQENAKRLRLVNKARGTERSARYQEIERSAGTEYKHYKLDPLFIAGLMLYIGYGDMTDERVIRFSGTDIAAQQIFTRFLIEYMGIERSQLRVQLVLYPAHVESVCMKQWSKALKLPYQQFHRTQIIKSAQKKPLHCGVGNTIIGSTGLKRKLVTWINLAEKDLVK